MAEPDDEERALARTEGTGVSAADAYERKYMQGEGLVLYRAKQRTPWPVTALLAGMAVVSLVPVVMGAAGAWTLAAITLPVLFLLWALMGVLRVTVSQGAVDVQYGLFGPRIPIAAIESVRPVEYKWTSVGGWGIHRGPEQSWVYSMPGDGGHMVRIEWRDAKGRRKLMLLGARDHQTLAKAIEQARRGSRAESGVIGSEAPRGQLRAGESEGEGE